MEGEKEHREKLRREFTRRKRLLQIRKARHGDAADPAIDTELEDIDAELARLAVEEAPPAPAPAELEAIKSKYGAAEDMWIAYLTSLMRRQDTTERQLTAIDERVADVERGQKAGAEWRDKTSEQIADLTAIVSAEREARVHGQRRNFHWSVAAVGVSALSFVLLIASVMLLLAWLQVL